MVSNLSSLYKWIRIGGVFVELDQGHQHGQTESSDQNVEDPSHVAQAEGARLLLRKCDTRQRLPPTFMVSQGFRCSIYSFMVDSSRSSALSMGETILSTVRKAARLAV
ncbi:hypothetical protein EYF80_043701 [Liparis tanakae]|uniref:Uncharacterized protein n=1 Tax=Liparis tanakae TaxID=230148 RepID=A0A4Z2FXT8_9TELE|nr:hypothetical protein EYF80_043701 [Liparis tanakae]